MKLTLLLICLTFAVIDAKVVVSKYYMSDCSNSTKPVMISVRAENICADESYGGENLYATYRTVYQCNGDNVIVYNCASSCNISQCVQINQTANACYVGYGNEFYYSRQCVSETPTPTTGSLLYNRTYNATNGACTSGISYGYDEVPVGVCGWGMLGSVAFGVISTNETYMVNECLPSNNFFTKLSCGTDKSCNNCTLMKDNFGGCGYESYGSDAWGYTNNCASYVDTTSTTSITSVASYVAAAMINIASLVMIALLY